MEGNKDTSGRGKRGGTSEGKMEERIEDRWNRENKDGRQKEEGCDDEDERAQVCMQ